MEAEQVAGCAVAAFGGGLARLDGGGDELRGDQSGLSGGDGQARAGRCCSGHGGQFQCLHAQHGPAWFEADLAQAAFQLCHGLAQVTGMSLAWAIWSASADR